jgi:PIN domain nuclease of toxin-antitoxin system
MLNLDTHILLHTLTGKLTPRESKLLSEQPWGISAIHVWPITIDIAHASTQLGIQVDSADELVAATSIAHRVPLVTRDRKLRGWNPLTIA